MTEATITSRKDEMEKLKGYPIKKRRAILKARDELLALTPKVKATIKGLLDGSQPASKLPTGITREQLKTWQELTAKDETVKGIILAALEAPQSFMLTNDFLTGEVVRDAIIKTLKAFSQQGKDRLANALKTDDTASLDIDQQKSFAIVSFFIAYANYDTRRELGDILNLSEDDLNRIIARMGYIEKGTFANDDKQMLLPFEELIDTDKTEPQIFKITPIAHSQKALFPISKFAQYAHKLIPDGKPRPIEVIPATKKRDAVYISVITEMPPEITTNRKITPFDRAVEDAIGNIIDDQNMPPNGTINTTPDVVWRKMNGMEKGAQVGKAAVQKVNESMEKLAKTWCVVDFTKQLQAMGNNLEKAEIKQHIILAKTAYLKHQDGTEKDGWEITGRPLIYEYSKLVKQVATIDNKLLQTKNINNTEEVMKIRRYLLQQIERIRRKPGEPGKPNVLYDTIFIDTEDPLPMEKTGTGRKTRTNRIKIIKAILDGFTEAGHIAGWREAGFGNRKQKTGIEIDAKPKKQAIE
jgi:hypothetical protein